MIFQVHLIAVVLIIAVGVRIGESVGGVKLQNNVYEEAPPPIYKPLFVLPGVILPVCYYILLLLLL